MVHALRELLSVASENPLSALGGIAGIAGLCVICQIVYNVFLHPLRKFPGPRSRAAFAYINYLDEIRGEQAQKAKELHDKYGSVVRLGPKTLSFNTARAWRDIYGIKPGKPEIGKDPQFYTQDTKKAPSLLVSNHADHARIRRIMVNSFSDGALRDQEPIIIQYADLLLTKWKEITESPSKGLNDMSAWYMYLTFDIMADLCFAEPFHALSNGEYHPWMTLIMNGARNGGVVRMERAYPFFAALIKFAKRMVYGDSEFNVARTQHMKYSIEKTDGRLDKQLDRKDIINPILRKIEQGGEKMTRAEITQTIIVLLFGGTEPTASGMSGLTYNLLTHRDVLDKLTTEIETAFKSEAEITNAKCTKLPYMNAVIQESLRVFPPAPCRFPRRTEAQGAEVDGYFIPGDISIGVHQLATYHSASNFYKPLEFHPERWLPNPPAEFKNDALDAVFPFSTGPRNCIGKPMAYMQIRHTLCRLLMNFKMELQPDSANWTTSLPAGLFWHQHPLNVKLSFRQK